ncbi:MAG: hypothetical protein QOE52_24, partial [Mycobacterium sp.]|nr:hypothetical protein [Mycobacterium sp.]
LGRVDLFSVKESDNKHDAVLSSQRGLARSYDRSAAGPDPLWGGGVNGAETLHDNQSRAVQVGNGPAGPGSTSRSGPSVPDPPTVEVVTKKRVDQRTSCRALAFDDGVARPFIG